MVEENIICSPDTLRANRVPPGQKLTNKFPVLLGGEHSVSIGAVKAFKDAYPNISVLHLDAHCDLRDEYFGSKLNHGCVARRMSEICPVVQVGTRSMSKEEKEQFLHEVDRRCPVSDNLHSLTPMTFVVE